MKKMYFALLMLGLVLTSCGGSAYTTDKDEALELAQEILDEEKEVYKEYLDYAKEVKEKKDKILKEYSGKESKLMKKAKKGDKDALSALKELRNLDINSAEKYEDMGKSLQKKQRAFNLSIDDIRALNDSDDLEDWEEDLAKIEKKRNKARDDYFEDYEELMKDDDDDDGYGYGDVSSDAGPDDYYDDYGAEQNESTRAAPERAHDGIEAAEATEDAFARDFEGFYDEYGTEEAADAMSEEYYDDYNYSEK